MTIYIIENKPFRDWIKAIFHSPYAIPYLYALHIWRQHK